MFKYSNGEFVDYSVSEDYVPGYVTTTEIKANDENRDKYTAMITNKYSPYADLTIKKNIKNATNASKNTPFIFKLTITKQQDNTNDPYYVSGEWSYETSAGTTGTITNGGTLTLHGGETATIKNIPSDTTYQVEEVDIPAGWKLTEQENVTGTLKAIPVSEDTNSSVTAQYGLTAQNDSNGIVLFDPLLFTSSDDGKTFIYDIIEYDDEQTNIVYDVNTIRAEISVHDVGDGTMVTNIAYTKKRFKC